MATPKKPENHDQLVKAVAFAESNIISAFDRVRVFDDATAFRRDAADFMAVQEKHLANTNLRLRNRATADKDNYMRLRGAILNATTDRFKVTKKADLKPVPIELAGGGTLTPVLER